MKWSWPWRRETPASIKFSELGWDVHSHLVPGVDDGATGLDDSLEMVRYMVNLGYRGMVLTPHIMSDLYPNSPETLNAPFQSLVDAVKKEQIPIKLKLAAEYLLEEDTLRLLKKGDPMTFSCMDGQGHKRRVMLMEMGFHEAPSDALVKEVIFEAQGRGMVPLLAHCERYPYLHRNASLLELWYKRGGWLSVNATSLAGAYGPDTRDMAKRCMQLGWISFVCSDAHCMRHLHALESLKNSRDVSLWLNAGHSLHAGLG